MAKKDRQFRVAHAFSARTKDGVKVWFTRGNQHTVTEALTAKQLDDHVAAGNLVELNGSTTLEALVGTAPNPVELQEAGE